MSKPTYKDVAEYLDIHIQMLKLQEEKVRELFMLGYMKKKELEEIRAKKRKTKIWSKKWLDF